jgi:imidazolonepropionase-like amidohydrolase
MYYKAESAVASIHAGKILHDNGLVPIYVSDNPVLNAQHVVFEAAKAYRAGLPYHVSMASVTTAPAERLGLGNRVGKIKEGFDADIVVWDSDPLSVGATPLQVWIDGDAQFKDPVVLNKTFKGAIVPDETLADVDVEGKSENVDNIIFTGVTSILLPGHEQVVATAKDPVNVVVHSGKIACVGSCLSHLTTFSTSSPSSRKIALRNGYLAPALTAFGGTLGLNAIDAEENTDNGSDESRAFARGVDGLAVDSDKLHAAYSFGVTRAISAPKFNGQNTHHGTSVGFLTGVKTTGDHGAIWSEDVSAHFTLARGEGEPGLQAWSSVVGAIRAKLLTAVKQVANDTLPEYSYGGQAFLKEVVKGKFPLVFTAHVADGITAILRVKRDVEKAIAETLGTEATGKIKVAIIGGAEAPLVASAMATADVGVILAPFQSYRKQFDERRALTGAPLTNGTTVDALVNAGVKVAIGVDEDWVVRDLGLFAGIAYTNGEGKWSEKEALKLVGSNIWDILGLEQEKGVEEEHFVVYEGSPLEIGGRVKAVGGGLGSVTVFG